jgi:hypothetical protein
VEHKVGPMTYFAVNRELDDVDDNLIGGRCG